MNLQHRAKVEFEIVERARNLKEFDNMKLEDIRDLLQKEGHFIPKDTLIDWLFFRTRASR